MADLLDTISDALTPKVVQTLAGQLGIDRGDVQKLIGAAMPLLLERLQQNAKSGDADNIASALQKDHDGSLLDDVAGFAASFRGGPGTAILSHVFGDQLDGAVAQVVETTGLPQGVVRLGFSALAPVAMAAMTKAALGAVTAVVVVKLLDVAVDGVRSGKAQKLLGSVNRRFDDDRDGNALDDVGRDALAAAKKGGFFAAGAARRLARSKRLRSGAGRGAKAAKKTGTKAAKAAAKKLGSTSVGKKLGKKLGGLFGR